MDEYAKYGAGMGGVATAAVLSKDPWRVTVTRGIAGCIMVLVFGQVASDLMLRHFGLPKEMGGFLLGAFGVLVFNKIADLIVQLNILGPLQSVFEKWTGAKKE